MGVRRVIPLFPHLCVCFLPLYSLFCSSGLLCSSFPFFHSSFSNFTSNLAEECHNWCFCCVLASESPYTYHTTTCSREVDEQLATLNDHHDFVLSRLDTLCTTVQQHSKNFEVLQKSIASQQAVIANMMVKFSKLDKPSTIPPLLDKP